MGARWRRVGGEAAKFSAVNVVATLVAVVLFNVLAHGVAGIHRPGPLNGWPVTSWFIANCVGMAISFYGSRRYAFKHRLPSGPGGGALNYVMVNLASFTIPMACLWITRNSLGWNSALADNVSANVVGAALGMLFRFWAFRRFVFKKRAGLWHGSRSRARRTSGDHAPGDHAPGDHAPGQHAGGEAPGRQPSAAGPELRPHETELLEHEA